MNAPDLTGKTVAILATNGYEQSELERPLAALEKAGAKVHVVSPESGEIQGMHHDEKGDTRRVDKTIDEVSPDDYDGLVLPGGVANPDALRGDRRCVAFVKGFFEQSKPVAAICHGPWTLVEADVLKGRTLTSWPTLRTDIRNAGGTWVDEEVHVDDGLVTSRKPDDLDAFCAKAIEEFAAGRHAGQTA